MLPGPASADPRAALRADCARCAGLCCVAPSFAESSEFAFDKPAGEPCVNLAADFRCAIHPNLRERGFAGCVAYDCFGAGQRVTLETFGGRTWRDEPEVAASMFESFAVIRVLHELRWYLAEALALPAARSLRRELEEQATETERLAAGPAAALRALDVGAHHRRVNGVLRRAAALARAGSGGPGLDRRGADMAGADLREVDLRGADLRGALLLGADLTGADLAQADLTGADCRGADVRGADLSRALFLNQAQADGAVGDVATRLPSIIRRPAHWG